MKKTSNLKSAVKIVFVLFLVFVCFLVKAQPSIDFRIANYSAIAGTSLTFTVQVKATGSVTAGTATTLINTSNNKVTGSPVVTYSSNYSSYSGTCGWASNVTTITTSSAGTTTVSTSYEDFFTVTLADTGSSSDHTDITFGTITLTGSWSTVTINSTTGLTNQPLPVTLVSFTGYYLDDSPFLKWTTATEINNDFFVVEKSTNAIVWENVGTVKGAGNSSSLAYYSFKVKEPINDVTYFRLKQVDYDGKTEYSKFITLKSKASQLGGLKIYPNPCTGTINLYYTGEDLDNTFITVFNTAGECILKTLFKNELDVSTVPSGLYYLQIVNSDESITEKLFVK